MEKIKYRSKFELLFGNRLLTALLILIQFAVIVTIIAFGSRLLWLNIALSVLSIVTALHQLTRPNKHAFKFPWIFLALLFPVVGGILYWILHFLTNSPPIKKSLCLSNKQWHTEFSSLCESQKNPQNSMRDKTFFSFMRGNACPQCPRPFRD